MLQEQEKKIILAILNKDMDDTNNVIKSLEHSAVLIDGVSETVKHEIKKQESGFLGMLLATLGASKLGNMLIGKGVMVPGKGVVRAGRGHNNINHLDKNF